MLIKINKNKPDKSLIQKAVEILNKGGVLVAPTETAYGFICDATNARAIDRVYKIKVRKKKKYLPLVVASLVQMRNFFELGGKELLLVEKYPGLSIILRPKVGAQKQDVYLAEGQENCAIRISTSSLIGNLARKFGRPLTASSANLAGKDICYSVNDIYKQIHSLEKKVDMILDGGVLRRRKPSTIIRVDGGKVEILRQGEIEIN